MNPSLVATLAVTLSACCSAPRPAAEPVAPEPVAPARLDPGRPAIPRPGAGISIEEAFEPERLVAVGGYDIVVVTVVASDLSRATTYGDPPRVALHIDEVLAGTVAPGARDGLWAPPPHGVDWTGAGAREALAEWSRRPLAAPAVGARLIALGKDVDGRYHLSARLREPFTDAARAVRVDKIARARAARDAAATERAAAAEKEAADEAARIATARPEDLVPKAELVVVATMSTLGIDGNGHRVRLAVRASLHPARPGPATYDMILVSDEEMARFAGGGEVLVFAASARWESPLGGELDGLRIVDPRHGVLPATPELVARTEAAVRARR